MPHVRGTNHNIYSQSSWTAGTSPSAGTNYVATDTRTIDYYKTNGMNFMRMMFTWEWLQPTLLASIPGAGAYLTYWNDFVATVNYATSKGITVMIEHFGNSSNFWPDTSENTTPSWKGVGSADGVSYTNQIGGASVTNTHFSDLWTKLATFFKGNPLVSYGMCNEPHDMSTMQWFATVQAAITAIRNTGSNQWIYVPGNGYATWDWNNSSVDNAGTARSNQYGWENANGASSPLNDPLNKLVAQFHVYPDDQGGNSFNINAVGAGTQANAIVDRCSPIVNWAKTFNAANPTRKVKVFLGEVGYYGAATNAGLGGNYSLATAQACWAAFIAYLKANADVFIGYTWWGSSEIGWWDDPLLTHFAITPTTAGSPYTGDTVNMTLIKADFPK